MDLLGGGKQDPVELEELGVRADAALFNNQRFVLDLIVMLSRRITGPFGGYISVSPEEMRAAQGYRIRAFVQGVDQKTGAGEATYNLEVTPPPGWSPLKTKSL